MTYYLTIKSYRRNAKKHIVTKGSSIEELRALYDNLDLLHIVAIYDGHWNLVDKRPKNESQLVLEEALGRYD